MNKLLPSIISLLPLCITLPFHVYGACGLPESLTDQNKIRFVEKLVEDQLYTSSLDVLECFEELDLDSPYREKAIELRGKIYLASRAKQWSSKAQDALEKWLELKTTSEEEEHLIKLALAKIHFSSNRESQAIKLLTTIPEDSTHYEAAQLLITVQDNDKFIPAPPPPAPPTDNLFVGVTDGPSVKDQPSIFDPKNPPPTLTESENIGIQVQDTLLWRKLKEQENKRRAVELQYNSSIFEQLRGQINTGPQSDQNLSVAIEVNIEVDGTVSRSEIKEGSSSESFDALVRDYFQEITFPKLPPELAENPPYIVTIRLSH